MSASSEDRRQRAGLVRRWAWAWALGASLCTLTTRGAASAPLWPSAGDAARRTLNDPASPPEVGVSIVEASDALHPAAASALLASAAMNPSRAVRRAAVLRCAQRRLIACLPAAITQWRRGLDPDPESRAAYLALLRLFIDERVAAILVDALHAPDPDLRAAVASSLLDAPLSDAVRPAILEALTSRAADKIPTVRAAVLPTLSALDPTGRPAALLQGLDDPEPLVRASAATAVGRLADRRFAPRLLAMLEAPSTPDIAAAVLTALAGTPGPEVDAALLRFLETPPTHLSQSSVAWAIARRGPFSRTTLEALLSLLDDPTLTDTVSRTLAGNLSPDDLTEIRARLRTRARVRPSSRTALRALLDASGPWTDAPSEPSAPSATAGAGFLEIQRTRALRVARAHRGAGRGACPRSYPSEWSQA